MLFLLYNFGHYASIFLSGSAKPKNANSLTLDGTFFSSVLYQIKERPYIKKVNLIDKLEKAIEIQI